MGGRNPLMRTRRRPARPVMSGGAATAYAVVGKHGPGYDGDYDDEVEDGSQWAQIEVYNEKAEPASIDGEYGGGAFSSYNRVHVAVLRSRPTRWGLGLACRRAGARPLSKLGGK